MSPPRRMLRPCARTDTLPPMAAFLFKTEPSTYAFADLAREKHAVWDGVSNPVALRNLRAVKKGDTVLIYHTGSEKAVVGLASAASDAYPDPKDRTGRLVVVDLAAGRALKRPVPLSTFKTDATLRTVAMVRQPRLSVMPISAAQLERVLHLAGG